MQEILYVYKKIAYHLTLPNRRLFKILELSSYVLSETFGNL
jgi:hypothetical protein